MRPGLNTGLIMHRTQGDTSRAPRSAAEPQRDVWRGRVRTHLARPTPDEEGFRVADRSGPAATPARTRNTKSRRSAGKMKMFRGQRFRCAYLTSEAIERFDAARLSDTQILSLNLRVRILRQNLLIFSTASSLYSPDSVAGIASHHVPHVTAPAATKLPLLLNDPDLSHEPHLSAAHGTADTVESTGSSDHGRCDRGDGDEHRNRTIALSGPPGYQAENTAPHAPQKERAQLEVPNRGRRVLR